MSPITRHTSSAGVKGTAICRQEEDVESLPLDGAADEERTSPLRGGQRERLQARSRKRSGSTPLGTTTTRDSGYAGGDVGASVDRDGTQSSSTVSRDRLDPGGGCASNSTVESGPRRGVGGRGEVRRPAVPYVHRPRNGVSDERSQGRGTASGEGRDAIGRLHGHRDVVTAGNQFTMWSG